VVISFDSFNWGYFNVSGFDSISGELIYNKLEYVSSDFVGISMGILLPNITINFSWGDILISFHMLVLLKSFPFIYFWFELQLAPNSRAFLSGHIEYLKSGNSLPKMLIICWEIFLLNCFCILMFLWLLELVI